MAQIDPPHSRRRKAKAAPRPPAPDHLVLCPIDCDRPLDQCHCLRGMLEDRGLSAAPVTTPAAPQPSPDWHSLAPGAIQFEPDFSTGLAPLLIALALGVTAAVSFGLAWWLA